jgi:hypothetical protein
LQKRTEKRYKEKYVIWDNKQMSQGVSM